jgi:hypothetical protein
MEDLFPKLRSTRGQTLAKLALRLGVTPRQAEVLALLERCEVVDTQTASEMLGFEVQTFKVHVSNLRRKGWEIGSVRGVGCYLLKTDRDRVREALK